MAIVAKETYDAALEAAYAKRDRRGPKPNVKRKAPARGLCGEYDRFGKFQKCELPGYSERSSLFCQQCRRYFHLPCFFASHYCGKMR
mmetsp:Transcript_40297/g.106753  ORF Transcript_40297/g.106753 Transcript_40297/m.106753 type:complete len:87 (+) Transcript_40297:610-870(+)